MDRVSSRPQCKTLRRGRREPSVTSLLGLVAVFTIASGSAPMAAQPAPDHAPPGAEVSLGVTDRGIFSDLDGQVRIELDPDAGTLAPGPAEIELILVATHALAVLSIDDWPRKVYPTAARAPERVDELVATLRPHDRRELMAILEAAKLDLDAVAFSVMPDRPVRTPSANRRAQPSAELDRDNDGIPDPLDILIGAKKTVLNRAAYGAGYQTLDYPMGDISRQQGVCTDVVIRAVRNAGLDLQQALTRDIRRAPNAYPMVRRPNPHIDHRRVRTLLPYFQRHWLQRHVGLNDDADPYRPGDIVFMDTIPKRHGPDHIGIVSDRIGASGYPLVINNWYYGTVTAEMDILAWVPVTHRFRIRPARR